MPHYKKSLWIVLVSLVIALVGVILLQTRDAPQAQQSTTESKSESKHALDYILANCVGTVGVNMTVPLNWFDGAKLSVTCSEIKPEVIDLVKRNMK